MENNTFFNRRLLQYMATDTGDSQFRGYLATAEQHYPQYVDEIRGMASGANITFNKVLCELIVNSETVKIFRLADVSMELEV